MHKGMKDFTARCMKLYRDYPALYMTDYDPEGFRWINSNDKNNSICSFLRMSPDENNHLLFVLNFTPVERNNFKVGVPVNVKYKLVLGSDEANQQAKVTPVEEECDGYRYSLHLDLKRFGICVYQFNSHDVRNTRPDSY